MSLSKKTLYFLGAIILTLPLIYFLLGVYPQRQGAAYRAKFSDEEVQKFPAEQKIQYERNVADIEDKTRLTLAQIIGGLALLSGLYFTYQNVKTAQENLRVTEGGKITERFSKAVELLGSEKLDIRLGGIYALERIAHDSQKDHWTVMEVLTAFVRENAPYNPDEKKDSEEQTKEQKPREDIQAIMTVIGRRKWIAIETHVLNLQRVNLAGCILNEANLSQADLREANLWQANLNETDLSGADLSEADLSEADLWQANLSETDLSGAYLIEANLWQANLWQANLNGARLSKADLSGANLGEANLSEGNLSEARLAETNFGGATLYKTDLSSAAFITLEQILAAMHFKKVLLSPKLEKELKEYRAKQAEEKAGAGEDSSANQSEK